jgi:hypothetical protein
VFVSMVWVLFMLGHYLHKTGLKRAQVLKAVDEENLEKLDEEVVQIEIIEELKS